MNANSYEYFFVNFANRTKLSIIIALKDKPLSVKEICKKINVEQSAVSHNLKKLAKCNILDVKQAGKERIYSLNKQTVLPMLKIVEKHVKSNCPMRCEKCM